MNNFRPINRDTGFRLPPSVDEWLPQRHLARFVLEGVEGLDLSELEKTYRGSGSASCPLESGHWCAGLFMHGYAEIEPDRIWDIVRPPQAGRARAGAESGLCLATDPGAPRGPAGCEAVPGIARAAGQPVVGIR